MSVNWECGECQAYIEAKELDEDSKEWHEFCVMREALIWALLVTGFPPKSPWKITEKNWREIYHRLYVTEKIGGSYRSNPNDGQVKFTPEEVHSMIGLCVNAGNRSEAEFYKWVKYRMRENSDLALHKFDEKSEAA